MATSVNRLLRARIFGEAGPLLLPGAPNALAARILEDAGAEAVYVSGAGVSNTFLGAPDIGLLTVTEMVQHVSAIRDAVEIPLVVDADTGFGNALNVQRAVRSLERAGASAIQLEDQVTPKKCGHFDGKEIISAAEMVGKIHAALDARSDDDLIVIARTDARSVLGFDEALDRVSAYRDAGADCIFLEAPETLDELVSIPKRVPGAHVANMVEGGKTPILPLETLGDSGYSIVLYANTVQRGGLRAQMSVASRLLGDGDSLGLSHQISDWDERQTAVRKDLFDNLSEKYGGDHGSV